VSGRGRIPLFLSLCLYLLACGPVEKARWGMDTKARQDACERIAETVGTRATGSLIGFLDDRVLWWSAAGELAELRDPRAVAPLVARAKLGGDRAERFVWAVGEIGGPQALSELRQLAVALGPSIDDTRLREAVEGAISKIERGNSGTAPAG